MAYWESTRLYPDNRNMFGDKACTPILHHKFPDNCITHIYKQGGRYINILGIQFENIEHPKDINGKYMSNIVGYRIVRGNRDGNHSIITKGIVTNVRSYKEKGEEVLYTNYPFNDLNPDNFLSSTQSYYKSGEKGFAPLTDFKKDQFNLYSPGTTFAHTSIGEEIKFLTEEKANVEGNFEEPYKHPRQKLLTQFDLYFALILGALDGYYATTGKQCTTAVSDQKFTVGSITTPAGPTPPTVIKTVNSRQESACDDALKFTSSSSVDKKKVRVAEKILRTLAKVGVFAYFTLDTANKVLDIIRNYSPWQQYALQYNSHGTFTSFKCIPKDNKRRRVDYYQYLYDGINTVQDVKYNNFKRESSVYLKLNEEVKVPTVKDNTRKTLSEFSSLDDKFKTQKSTASAYYVAIKRKNPEQYGSLDGIQYLDTGYSTTTLTKIDKFSDDKIYKTDVIFGGDTYINKMSVKRSQHFFSQFLKDVPDGYIYDYRTFRNVGYPRYWMDSTPYDLSEFISLKPKQSNTPKNKFNLQGNNPKFLEALTVVKDHYFYLFNSGAMEFFVESPYNLDYRDWKKDSPNFYSKYNRDLSTLFRTDKIEEKEEFIYDRSYSKQLTENGIYQQRLDFDPLVDATCYQYLKNRVIYSLPAFKDQKADNWKTYLANNFYDFPMGEFGELTVMHAIDNQQIIFLFDKASPYITVGRDELQLDGSGKKITLGDGGLFAREPRPLAHTDFHYGNSQSKRAFVNTQFGSFYPSQRQGRIFNYTGKLDELSKNGMYYWFKNYLPSKLLQEFPDFKDSDNTLVGTGLISVFDNNDERYYLTKRDFSIKPEHIGKVTYNKEKNKFYYGVGEISLSDVNYFNDASWTISYSPKDQSFISWHDWHPDFTLQTENHFLSVRNKAIWKHNVSNNSFCNFYGKQYPFSFELLINNGQNNEILRSIEYQM